MPADSAISDDVLLSLGIDSRVILLLWLPPTRDTRLNGVFAKTAVFGVVAMAAIAVRRGIKRMRSVGLRDPFMPRDFLRSTVSTPGAQTSQLLVVARPIRLGRFTGAIRMTISR